MSAEDGALVENFVKLNIVGHYSCPPVLHRLYICVNGLLRGLYKTHLHRFSHVDSVLLIPRSLISALKDVLLH